MNLFHPSVFYEQLSPRSVLVSFFHLATCGFALCAGFGVRVGPGLGSPGRSPSAPGRKGHQVLRKNLWFCRCFLPSTSQLKSQAGPTARLGLVPVGPRGSSQPRAVWVAARPSGTWLWTRSLEPWPPGWRQDGHQRAEPFMVRPGQFPRELMTQIFLVICCS